VDGPWQRGHYGPPHPPVVTSTSVKLWQSEAQPGLMVASEASIVLPVQMFADAVFPSEGHTAQIGRSSPSVITFSEATLLLGPSAASARACVDIEDDAYLRALLDVVVCQEVARSPVKFDPLPGAAHDDVVGDGRIRDAAKVDPRHFPRCRL